MRASYRGISLKSLGGQYHLVFRSRNGKTVKGTVGDLNQAIRMALREMYYQGRGDAVTLFIEKAM